MPRLQDKQRGTKTKIPRALDLLSHTSTTTSSTFQLQSRMPHRRPACHTASTPPGMPGGGAACRAAGRLMPGGGACRVAGGRDGMSAPQSMHPPRGPCSSSSRSTGAWCTAGGRLGGGGWDLVGCVFCGRKGHTAGKTRQAGRHGGLYNKRVDSGSWRLGVRRLGVGGWEWDDYCG